MEATRTAPDMTRVMDLVKDGVVYEAFRHASGRHLIRDTGQRQLPVSLETKMGVLVARVTCRDKCFIFDRRMFRAALRQVIRACRCESRDLVLDLSGVEMVGDGLLSVIRFLDNGLRRRNRSLSVISPSPGLSRHLLNDAPSLSGRVLRRIEDAFPEDARVSEGTA